MHRSRNRVYPIGMITVIVILGIVAPSGAYPRPGHTEIVSVSSTESQMECPLAVFCERWHSRSSLSVSADGRYVAFSAIARGLVPNDTNEIEDVFVRDIKKGTTTRVSVSSEGSQALPGISASECVERAQDQDLPTECIDGSYYPSISADGRFVAFRSFAPNLVQGDTNMEPDMFVHDLATRETERVSVSTDGGEANGKSGEFYGTGGSYVSGDGRVVAFLSVATNLVENDTNGVVDMFVRDRAEGKTERVSVTSNGEQITDHGGITPLQGGVSAPSVSQDGRSVAFSTGSQELVPGDTNESSDVFVFEMKTKEIERVSLASDGSEGRPTSPGLGAYFPVLSAHGRHVAFISYFSNLVPNHASQLATDVYVYDRTADRLERVSVTSVGEDESNLHGNYADTPISISGNGRFVVFERNRDGEGGTNWGEIALFDRTTGARDIVSVASDGSEGAHADFGEGAFSPAISADGRFAAFKAEFPNLVPHDENGLTDVFIRDHARDVFLGGWGSHDTIDATPRDADSVCVAPQLCVPPSEAVEAVDEHADVAPHLASLGADVVGLSAAYRPQYEDLMFTIELDQLPNLSARVSPISYGLRFRVGRSHYEVRATSLQGGTFGLFRCDAGSSGCELASPLRGGFGTTGARVTVSLPLEEIAHRNTLQIDHLEAFSAAGTWWTGATHLVDRVGIGR